MRVRRPPVQLAPELLKPTGKSFKVCVKYANHPMRSGSVTRVIVGMMPQVGDVVRIHGLQKAVAFNSKIARIIQASCTVGIGCVDELCG